MSTADPAARRCAVCAKPQAEEFKPFCSRRCADVDLQRWFAGAYAISAEPVSDEGRDSDRDE
jgi:endogenous inhibitor of DNA gyrase (YacG/DUF329 family)